ncbi:ANTAR domain-containing protein [Streptomyces sp. MBT62]|uniref:ANTAR domain-containing protein n=1 Tax=Streptomyces sp. MBT62 TaxID=2800410 RepID=UPI00190B9128|nr:ANTAR domain-containing protein [Streptomyces sp. MBT62]MBK3570796.1 ANTAR domain-containing protein [Streptomyces sp. MBT62]
MISDGMAEVLRSLRLGEVGDPAQVCARALGVAGVALSLLVGVERTAEPLWHHPELAARFEELQFTLGEGPGPDAVRAGSPVLEPDLARVRAERWPALLPAARELGVNGVCCFPLGIGAIRVGVLTVLCDAERRLSGQQYTDATALTAVLTNALLDGGPRDGDRPGLGAALEPPSVLRRAVVHQATGMVSAQLDVSVQEALLRLRAYAYGSEQPLREIAADVVARRLRFTDDFDDDVSGPYSPDGGKG